MTSLAVRLVFLICKMESVALASSCLVPVSAATTLRSQMCHVRQFGWKNPHRPGPDERVASRLRPQRSAAQPGRRLWEGLAAGTRRGPVASSLGESVLTDPRAHPLQRDCVRSVRRSGENGHTRPTATGSEAPTVCVGHGPRPAGSSAKVSSTRAPVWFRPSFLHQPLGICCCARLSPRINCPASVPLGRRRGLQESGSPFAASDLESPENVQFCWTGRGPGQSSPPRVGT